MRACVNRLLLPCARSPCPLGGREFLELGFKYDNLLMEESAQILEIETFIPMLLQVGRGAGLCGAARQGQQGSCSAGAGNDGKHCSWPQYAEGRVRMRCQLSRCCAGVLFPATFVLPQPLPMPH